MTQKRVLVVDDDPDIRSMLGLYLKREGYEVSFASDGMTCMGTAQRERPDLIVLDLGLPAGDGLSTLHRLRNLPHFAKTPVLVLTGREGDRWKEEALRTGASAYLLKPVTKEALLTSVRQLLSGTEVAAPASRALECPHCGKEIHQLRVQLDPATVKEIVEALRPVATV